MKHKKNILRIPYNQNLQDSVMWIRYAINSCRSGKRIYFSYLHFYDIVNKLGLISSDVHVLLVPSPNLIFIDSKLNVIYR